MLMSTLITILILALVVWFVFWICDAVPVPAPFNWVLKAIVAILVIIKVLSLVGIGF